MVKPLQGKKAIVTGAGRGIGRASALAMIENGADVIGLDLGRSDDDVAIFECDLTKEADIRHAVARAVDQFGHVDILVNNAGILEERPLAGIDAAHVERMFSVNVNGAILTARECLPYLRDGGRIINIVSELAYLGRANASVYCATKAALLALTRSWARELAPRILVNAVAPGPTDTLLLGFERLDPTEQAQEKANPLNRIGRAEEVAASVVFLAGPGATLFAGQCLGPNCGAVMY